MEKKLIDFETLCENCKLHGRYCGHLANLEAVIDVLHCPIWQGLESVPDITARVLLKNVLKSRESKIYFFAELLNDTPDIDKIIKKVERERG